LDNLIKGNSLSKDRFIEKKNHLNKEFIDYNINSNNNNNNNIKSFSVEKEKDIKNSLSISNTIYNNEIKIPTNKLLEENNFYFDKNNKQMVRHPKNFFKKALEKKSRTKISSDAPDWFKVVTDEKNKMYDEIIAKNEETLSIFSRYNKWITVTPKSKNRRKPLEKMKIEKMDETSKIMPNWMQIRVKKDMDLYGKMRSAEYNSIRHVIN
jgi:hypothetical protein